MKTLKVIGWAVIFTVTLLLAACDTNSPKVADTSMMSGSDETMTQQDNQSYEHEDSAILVSQEWLNEREKEVEQGELYQYEDSAIMISQAWLNEGETRLAQGVPGAVDMNQPEEIYTFNQQAWFDDRAMLVRKETGPTDSIKLAGADSTFAKAGSSPIRVEGGRCYASVVHPAEYKTVAVTKPIEVPKGENLPILYQSVTERVKVTDEQMRWEEILCKDRMTESQISEVQRALSRSGYNPGPINGIVGPQTMAAVNAFQKDFKLSVANHLTIETVKALDANY